SLLPPRAERSGNRETEEGTATAAGVQRLGGPLGRWFFATRGRAALFEAHQGIGTAVFAGAPGRSPLAPANLALWKVDKEVYGVVQPSVVDLSRYDVGLLVFIHHLDASRLFLPLVPRPVGLALEHAVKQLVVRWCCVFPMGDFGGD